MTPAPAVDDSSGQRRFRRRKLRRVSEAASSAGPGCLKRVTLSVAIVRYVWGHPANRRRRCRAICRLLGWQLWQRSIRQPWTVQLARNIRLRCYPHSTSASAALYCRVPDWEEMRFVLDTLRPGDIFIDVGANVGTYSLLAASVPDVCVWAFEPSSLAYARAVENVALNALENRVRVVRAAVGATEGTALLTTGLDTVNRVAKTGDFPDLEEVPLVALDAFLTDHGFSKVRIIKIDVEGGEVDVILGAANILSATKPALLVERNHPEQLFQVLEKNGYTPFRYNPDARSLSKLEWSSCSTSNVLAIHDVMAFERRLAPRRPTENVFRRVPEPHSANPDTWTVLVAAGTARGAGGVVALRAACSDLATRLAPTIVQVPRHPDPSPLPHGLRYKRVSRVGAIVREVVGPARRDVGTYVGMSDRLPLLRSFPRRIMIAQNPHLYAPMRDDLTRAQRTRIHILRAWAGWSARRADLIITASRQTRLDILGTTRADAQRIVVRPIPVLDIRGIKVGHRDQIERIALVGDFYGYKRFDWALDELQQWAAKTKSTIIVDHAGGIAEKRAQRLFQQAVHRSPLVSVYCHGKLFRDETMAMLVAADILIFPSARESFGLPLAEALALGVPVVCTDLPQFREIGGSAPAFFDGSDGSLAAALERVVRRETREEMANRGLALRSEGRGWNVLDETDDR